MKDKNYLYNAYNATSTDDGNGELETYENWLERQLLSRIEKLEQLAFTEVVQVKPEKEFYCKDENYHINHNVVARLDSLNIGDKYKYNPNDFGIFIVEKKEEEHWIETRRTQNNRKSGDFPWVEIYPL